MKEKKHFFLEIKFSLSFLFIKKVTLFVLFFIKDLHLSRVPTTFNYQVFCFVTGMIMGAAVSTVYYNLKLRHPTLNMPIIDYDLALLIQPMLMLGISIGVVFNVVFPYWIVTILLIVLFLGNNYFNCDFN